MDLIKELNLGTAGEFALTVAIIYGAVALIKKSKIDNKWMPWIASVLGVVAGVVVVVVNKDTNWASGAVMGLLLGFAASGAYDGIKSFGKTPDTSDPVPAEPVQANPQGPLVPDNNNTQAVSPNTSGVTGDGQH